MNVVSRLVQAGYLTVVETLEACPREVGGVRPIVSKFGFVERTKHGKTKHRLILNCKESGITAFASTSQRIMLPTVLDSVFDGLPTLARPATHEGTEFTVLDVKDAFCTLCNQSAERRFFVGTSRGRHYIFNRLAQGSRGAPLAWCRFFALVVRLTLALFAKNEARAEVSRLSRLWTRQPPPVLVWRALNLQLPCAKGHLGRKVTWTGCVMELVPEGVTATLQADTVTELKSLFRDAQHLQWLPTKSVGKVSNTARVLVPWSPFLADFWAAIAAAEKSSMPNRVWTKQVSHALAWFAAFLQDEHGSIVRRFLTTVRRSKSLRH